MSQNEVNAVKLTIEQLIHEYNSGRGSFTIPGQPLYGGNSYPFQVIWRNISNNNIEPPHYILIRYDLIDKRFVCWVGNSDPEICSLISNGEKIEYKFRWFEKRRKNFKLFHKLFSLVKKEKDGHKCNIYLNKIKGLSSSTIESTLLK